MPLPPVPFRFPPYPRTPRTPGSSISLSAHISLSFCKRAHAHAPAAACLPASLRSPGLGLEADPQQSAAADAYARPSLSLLLSCADPFRCCWTLVQPCRADAVDERRATKRATDRASERTNGYRVRNPIARLLDTSYPSKVECIASSVYSPFALLIRGGFAVSTPMQACKQCKQAMQRNATNAMQRTPIAFAFHHPLSHTALASRLLLRFSCFSASACPPAKRIAVLFRSSFWLISQRRAACSETRGNHSPVTRTPLLNPHEYESPTSLICPDGYRHHPRSFNPSLRRYA